MKCVSEYQSSAKAQRRCARPDRSATGRHVIDDERDPARHRLAGSTDNVMLGHTDLRESRAMSVASGRRGLGARQDVVHSRATHHVSSDGMGQAPVCRSVASMTWCRDQIHGPSDDEFCHFARCQLQRGLWTISVFECIRQDSRLLFLGRQGPRPWRDVPARCPGSTPRIRACVSGRNQGRGSGCYPEFELLGHICLPSLIFEIQHVQLVQTGKQNGNDGRTDGAGQTETPGDGGFTE